MKKTYVTARSHCKMCNNQTFHLKKQFVDDVGEVALLGVWRVCDKCGFMESITETWHEEIEDDKR